MPQAPATQKPPGKRGYWWSGALALTSVLFFVLALLLVHHPIRTAPEIVAEMGWGEAVDFDVAGGEEDGWAVYITADHDFHDFHDCRSGLTDSVEGSFPSVLRESEKGPYGGWELIGVLDTPEPGNYFARCGVLGDEPGDGIEFALGTTSALHTAQAQEAAGLPIVLIGTPLSLIAAIVVGVVTALRRSSARKLALAVQESTPHSPYPQQAPQHPHPPQHPQHPQQR